MPVSKQAIYPASTNPGAIILLMFWGELSPISLMNFLMPQQ
jgi:hypothetical protein